ncbi:hypothetical protein OAE48_00830 [Flavobacteriales bacterium]|nr:hypothetical protein [Flavobacteriales bacterium]
MENGTNAIVVNHSVETGALTNFSITEDENGFVVAIVDDNGFESIRGFGETPTEAMNDLHRNLI